MARMSMVEAIRDAMDCKMAEDERVVVFGEDVGYFGGVFRCTDGLQRKYGKSRCFDAPINESGIVGVAIGMGAYGLRPVAEVQFADYVYQPACVKACPTGAIMFGSKSDMTAWAGERIVDLKSRGFKNARLYDPPGVSGTHVMYVLHHADRPSLYAGLPDNPRINLFVEAWKGVLKPLALAGVAFTAVAGFLHRVVLGSNEVEPQDEAAAADLIKKSGSTTSGSRT
jgi:ferredoxin